MRIDNFEKTTIIEAVQSIDKDASVWLFGSRTDDRKKGGDIDIAILSNKIKNDIMEEIKVKQYICDKIGEQQIDIISSAPDNQNAFFKIAVKEGIKLN